MIRKPKIGIRDPQFRKFLIFVRPWAFLRPGRSVRCIHDVCPLPANPGQNRGGNSAGETRGEK